MADIWNDMAKAMVGDTTAEHARWLANVQAQGEAAARKSAARGQVLADTLSSVPSQSTPFQIDGAHAIHYLRKSEGFLGSFDYCARVDIKGVLPRFVLHTLGRGDTGDAATFGPQRRMQQRSFGPVVTARTRAPDLLRAFDNDLIIGELSGLSLRAQFTQHSDRLGVLEVDAGVGNGRRCERAAAKAAQLASVCLALVGQSFTERDDSQKATPEQLESLLGTLSTSVTWLSGPVARVGDGVEARLALDEQVELPCSLRLDVKGDQTGSMYFRGPLQAPPDRVTKLAPQEGFFERLAGLVDAKVGIDAFDDAWLVDGPREGAVEMAAAEGEVLRLRRLLGHVELGPEGLVVRIPRFEVDDENLVDAVGSALSLWRVLVRRRHGLV